MKICVVGAGSIGGLLGVKLALAGEEVTLIARGQHLEAIQRDGLQLRLSDGSVEVARDVATTSDMTACGPQDLVILGLKAHQIESVVDDLRTLFGPDTMVLTTQNGLPWWYFQRHGGEFDGYTIKALDSDGRLGAGIEPERIIGCIAYPAAFISRPGVISHIEGMRFPVGELDGSESERVQRIAETLTRAGFKAPVLSDIRSEIWLKAWGNLSFNPISALCHATLEDICQFEPTRRLAENMMREAETIAAKLGVTFRVPLEKRIAGAERVGRHKTSMLQDVEAGKALETEALIGSILEIGELTGTPTPYIGAIYAAVKLLGRTIEQEDVFIKAQAQTLSPALAPVPTGGPALAGVATA
jgi:2-dehydropantoate 2-reductase